MNGGTERPTSLPKEVIDLDHELDGRYQQARGELARHRWHWTLNPDNAGRVTTRAYARQVERSHVTVYAHARGYAIWLERQGVRGTPNTGRTLSLDDGIELARMSDERGMVAELLAERFGTTVETIRKRYRNEIENVLHAARATAEREETSFDEEVGDVVKAVEPKLFTGEQHSQRRSGAQQNPVAECERRTGAAQAHARAIVEELLPAVLMLASREQLAHFASEMEETAELCREAAVAFETRTTEESHA